MSFAGHNRRKRKDARGAYRCDWRLARVFGQRKGVPTEGRCPFCWGLNLLATRTGTCWRCGREWIQKGSGDVIYFAGDGQPTNHMMGYARKPEEAP